MYPLVSLHVAPSAAEVAALYKHPLPFAVSVKAVGYFLLFNHTQPFCCFLFLIKLDKYGYSNLHRHHHRHPLATSWCLPQVWLSFGILDLFGADSVWLPPWNYICHICHHQVILSICLGKGCV